MFEVALLQSCNSIYSVQLIPVISLYLQGKTLNFKQQNFPGIILVSYPNQNNNIMYNTYIDSADKAVCHLFLHCCFRDGSFTEAEIDSVSAKFVTLGLQKDINFKDELVQYRSYRETIADERQYITDLIKQINPTNELALYSYCLELGLSDNTLVFGEEELLKTIGTVLQIDAPEQEVIRKVFLQRQVVAANKFF
jgi:hypothetical protein